jgi:hypothetical protein
MIAVARLTALLVGCVALSACRGHAAPSIAAHSAAGAANGAAARLRSFRLTPKGGIGFDDLWFSKELGAVLAPAGGTACVEVFAGASLARTSLCGIGPGGLYAGGHGEGTTSADFGAGLVFAIERNSPSLQVIDPKARRVLATAPLSAGPDYVRWVASKRELWVTEPDHAQIEIFSLSSDAPPRLAKAGTIAVNGGPESLIIDGHHGQAFTHLWQGRSVRIDIGSRGVGPSFPNECQGSRGIALDAAHGVLFAGCSEGKAVTIEIATGKALDAVETPDGVDIISLNLALRHLYVPAASDGTVTVLGVSAKGKLGRLGVQQADKGAHCATSDDHGRLWVCSPDAGSLLVFDDPFPPAAE